MKVKECFFTHVNVYSIHFFSSVFCYFKVNISCLYLSS